MAFCIPLPQPTAWAYSNTMEGMALITITGKEGSPPTLEFAAEQIGVAVEDLDAGFGVVAIDPRRSLYAVQARADRVPAANNQKDPYRGPFSNPKIAPFGPQDES